MIVLLGGSRHLKEEALVRDILGHVQARGWRVLTGCAHGIDATVRDAAAEMRLPLTIYTAAPRHGHDWGGRLGTLMQIRGMEMGGLATVQWQAGGTEGNMKIWLRRRTLAMVAAADWVVMVTAPDSKGSRLALEEARRLGKPWREYRRGEG